MSQVGRELRGAGLARRLCWGHVHPSSFGRSRGALPGPGSRERSHLYLQVRFSGE